MKWLVMALAMTGCGSLSGPECADEQCCENLGSADCTAAIGCHLEVDTEIPGNYPPPCGEEIGFARGDFCTWIEQQPTTSGPACDTLDEATCTARDDCSSYYDVSCPSNGNTPVIHRFVACVAETR